MNIQTIMFNEHQKFHRRAERIKYTSIDDPQATPAFELALLSVLNKELSEKLEESPKCRLNAVLVRGDGFCNSGCANCPIMNEDEFIAYYSNESGVAASCKSCGTKSWAKDCESCFCPTLPNWQPPTED